MQQATNADVDPYHVHTGINHGLHEHENISGPAATDGCSHVDEGLIIYIHLRGDSVEDMLVNTRH